MDCHYLERKSEREKQMAYAAVYESETSYLIAIFAQLAGTEIVVTFYFLEPAVLL